MGTQNFTFSKAKNQVKGEIAMPDPETELIAPIYIAETTSFCWKCPRLMTLISIAGLLNYPSAHPGEADQDFVFLSTVSWIPDWLKLGLQSRYPSFFIDYSEAEQRPYFMNHCSCKARFGDFYLHDEPGSPFFPMECGEATEITLTEIKGLTRLPFKGSVCAIIPDILLSSAQRKIARYVKGDSVVNTVERGSSKTKTYFDKLVA